MTPLWFPSTESAFIDSPFFTRTVSIPLVETTNYYQRVLKFPLLSLSYADALVFPCVPVCFVISVGDRITRSLIFLFNSVPHLRLSV